MRVELVRADALRHVKVGLSVSDSSDLSRLGLTPQHCELAIAEIARAIFIAGGTVVYGGRLVPAGFTGILLDEARQYRHDREALVLCVPETEHRKLSDEELRRFERELATSAELVCLDGDGAPIDILQREFRDPAASPADALTAMRRHVTDRCDARILVGGRLAGYQGSLPGVIEEARMSLEANQPLYVAGGFGGAAAAIAQALGHDDGGWSPDDYPADMEAQHSVLSEIAQMRGATSTSSDGLRADERWQLAVTHRPGDIASLTIAGLSRWAE
jgi:hypothetical protein